MAISLESINNKANTSAIAAANDAPVSSVSLPFLPVPAMVLFCPCSPCRGKHDKRPLCFHLEILPPYWQYYLLYNQMTNKVKKYNNQQVSHDLWTAAIGNIFTSLATTSFHYQQLHRSSTTTSAAEKWHNLKSQTSSAHQPYGQQLGMQ